MTGNYCAKHKISGFFRYESLGKPLHKKQGPCLRMKICVAVCFLLAVCSTSAGAIDLAELAPCKPAAARFCPHTGEMTWANLLECGAKLAANSLRVGNDCRALLRKYGQL